MTPKHLLFILAALAVPAGTGHALTINNEDQVDYVLEVVEGTGDASVESIDLPAGAALDDLCNSGCTISLGNGASHSFIGDEQVTIVDGEFVLIE